MKLAEKRELRLCSGRTERRRAAEARGSWEGYGGGRGPRRGSQRLQPCAAEHPAFNRREPASRSGPSAAAAAAPGAPRPHTHIAKERRGEGGREETEQMIERGGRQGRQAEGRQRQRLSPPQVRRCAPWCWPASGGSASCPGHQEGHARPQDGELKIRVQSLVQYPRLSRFLFSLSLFARSELGGAAWQSLGGHAARGGRSTPGRPPALTGSPSLSRHPPWPRRCWEGGWQASPRSSPRPDLRPEETVSSERGKGGQ